MNDKQDRKQSVDKHGVDKQDADKQDADEQDSVAPARSPCLIARDESALLIVDMQPKLLHGIDAHAGIQWNADRLVRGASILGVPVRVSEQYPEKLGNTVENLAPDTSAVVAKRMFSCRECVDLFENRQAESIRQIVLSGIETHVCVLQTALDLLAEGFDVFVIADATGSRSTLDRNIAFERMRDCGAILTTTESVLFEWCETSTAPEFKQISGLVTQTPPTV